MTREEFYRQFKRNILGYSPYGFLDQSQWKKFRKKYFYRSGKIIDDEYTPLVNEVLSGAAMQLTLEEIDNRLKKWFQLK